jgi:hypothetical protein
MFLKLHPIFRFGAAFILGMSRFFQLMGFPFLGFDWCISFAPQKWHTELQDDKCLLPFVATHLAKEKSHNQIV